VESPAKTAGPFFPGVTYDNVYLSWVTIPKLSLTSFWYSMRHLYSIPFFGRGFIYAALVSGICAVVDEIGLRYGDYHRLTTQPLPRLAIFWGATVVAGFWLAFLEKPHEDRRTAARAGAGYTLALGVGLSVFEAFLFHRTYVVSISVGSLMLLAFELCTYPRKRNA
jgi:hypothetical protein